MYHYAMLPNVFEKKRKARLLGCVLLFIGLCTYVSVQSFDGLFSLMVLSAAFMALFNDRPIKFGIFQWVIFALTAVMLISGFVNAEFAKGQTYIYDFSSVIFAPAGQDPDWIVTNFAKIEHTNGMYGLGYTFSHVIMWWLIACFTARRFTKYEIRTAVNAYVIVAGLAAVVMAVSNWNITTWASLDRGAIPFWFLGLNANIMPYFVMPMMVICFARVMVKFSWQSAIFTGAGLLTCVVCASRGGLYGLIISFVAVAAYLAVVVRNRKHFLIKIAVLFAVACVSMIIFWQVAPQQFAIIFRIGAESSGDVTGSGRTVIWEEALGYLQSLRDLVFGKGWGYYYFQHQGSIVAFYGLHNFFVQYLVNSGWIAACLAGAVWVIFFLRTLDLFGIALMGGTIMGLLVENGITATMFVIPILIFLAIRASEERGGRHCLVYYFLGEREQHYYPVWAAPKSKIKFFEYFRPREIA